MRLSEQAEAEKGSMVTDSPGPEILTGAVGPGRVDRALEENFSAWVREHQRSLLGFAQLVCGETQGAEDLVQGALSKAYLKWSRLSQPGQRPTAYVRRIIVNDHTSLWRRAWKRLEHSTDAVPERAGVPADADDATWALVQALPTRQRTAIALRFYADLSVLDTAAAMGCSTGAVKIHTSRAVAKLREALSDPTEGSSRA